LATEELLLAASEIDQTGPNVCSSDGQFILFTRSGEESRRDLWIYSRKDPSQTRPLLNSEFDEYRGQFSPTGSSIAYVSDESGSYEVYLRTLTAEGTLGGDKVRVSANGGNHPRFRRDGRELFYVALDGQLMSVMIHDRNLALPRHDGEP
jgi:Tol biopolymer transport system component